MQLPPIKVILDLHPPKSKVCAIELFYSRRLSCFLCHCSHSNLTLDSDTSCREFNQNSNLWETKQIEKTHVKENNHTHKTIFTWFGNLSTSTELQGFHYKIRRYNSAQEHSQETQFPIHPNTLSPTRQENTILSSYAATRLLGIISNSHSFFYITNLIYIYIYRSACTRNYNPSWIRFTCDLHGLVAIQATRAHFNMINLW